MTIDRAYGKLELICSICETGFKGRVAVYAKDEFDIMVQDAKDEGWKFYKENGEWVHVCPDCK